MPPAEDALENGDIDEEELEEVEEKLEIDYQIGEDIKEKVSLSYFIHLAVDPLRVLISYMLTFPSPGAQIIPRAIDYFTGKALEYEEMDDDDDFEDFEDDDDDDDDDGDRFEEQVCLVLCVVKLELC